MSERSTFSAASSMSLISSLSTSNSEYVGTMNFDPSVYQSSESLWRTVTNNGKHSWKGSASMTRRLSRRVQSSTSYNSTCKSKYNLLSLYLSTQYFQRVMTRAS